MQQRSIQNQCYVYIMSLMSHQQRSYLAQLKCRILPLHIETGTWYGVKEDRICKACNNNQIENEYHFIFHCIAYSTLWTTFYHKICSVMPTFIDNNDENKLNLLLNKYHVNIFSRYICEIYKIRQDILFKEITSQYHSPLIIITLNLIEWFVCR